MSPTVWVVIAVVAQGAVILALLKVIRTFGAYTNVVLQTHEQNMIIQQENWNMAQDLGHLRAQLYAERAAAAERRKQPPQSEDCVA